MQRARSHDRATGEPRTGLPVSATASPYLFFGGLAMSLAAVVTGAVYIEWESSLLVAWCLGINSAALFIMGLDKSLARGGSVGKGAQRVPEAVVFVVGLLGGSPGILLAMHLFRHKTKKVSFQFVMLLIFVAQIVIVRALP